jgi:hypothetical protein
VSKLALRLVSRALVEGVGAVDPESPTWKALERIVDAAEHATDADVQRAVKAAYEALEAPTLAIWGER